MRLPAISHFIKATGFSTDSGAVGRGGDDDGRGGGVGCRGRPKQGQRLDPRRRLLGVVGAEAVVAVGAEDGAGDDRLGHAAPRCRSAAPRRARPASSDPASLATSAATTRRRSASSCLALAEPGDELTRVAPAKNRSRAVCRSPWPPRRRSASAVPGRQRTRPSARPTAKQVGIDFAQLPSCLTSILIAGRVYAAAPASLAAAAAPVAPGIVTLRARGQGAPSAPLRQGKGTRCPAQ